jgi:nucleotide-binding universal stress UspA family protein
MIQKFKRILAPVDFTSNNDAALEAAVELAKDAEGEVTLLHVIETIESIPHEELADFYAMLEERAEARLAALAARHARGGTPLDAQILYGKPVPNIVQFVLARQIDLVILSSHPIDLDQPQKGFGSVSHQVSIFCPCAVLLVKQP